MAAGKRAATCVEAVAALPRECLNNSSRGRRWHVDSSVQSHRPGGRGERTTSAVSSCSRVAASSGAHRRWGRLCNGQTGSAPRLRYNHTRAQPHAGAASLASLELRRTEAQGTRAPCLTTRRPPWSWRPPPPPPQRPPVRRQPWRRCAADQRSHCAVCLPLHSHARARSTAGAPQRVTNAGRARVECLCRTCARGLDHASVCPRNAARRRRRRLAGRGANGDEFAAVDRRKPRRLIGQCLRVQVSEASAVRGHVPRSERACRHTCRQVFPASTLATRGRRRDTARLPGKCPRQRQTQLGHPNWLQRKAKTRRMLPCDKTRKRASQ